MDVPRASVRDVGRLVAFDLRRAWPLATAIVALEAVRAIVLERALHVQPSERGAAAAANTVATVDTFLFLLAIVTTAIVAQADHPDDDRAFWRTRPIPPAALGLAKVAVVGLLAAVVPAAIETLRLAAYGAPLDAIVASTLQIVAAAGLVILPTWALALATRTLPRFLAAAVIAWAIGLGVTMAAFWHKNWTRRTSPPAAARADDPPALVRTLRDWRRQDRHGEGVGVVLTGTGLIVIVALYQTRRRGLAAVGGAVILVGPSLWPAGDASPAAPASAAIAGAIGGRMAIANPIRVPARHWLEKDTHEAYVWAKVLLPGLPTNFSARIRWQALTMMSSASRVSGKGQEQVSGASPIDVVPRSVPQARPDQPIDPAFLILAPKHKMTLLASALAFRGEADLDLTEHRVIGTLPLAPGQAFRTEAFLLEIVRVGAWASEMRALVRLVRFPGPGRTPAGPVSCFVRQRDGARVHPAQAFWGGYREGSGETFRQKAEPRQWVDLFSVLLNSVEPDATPAEWHLVLVESRDAGHLRATLATGDVPTRIVQ